MQVVLDSSALVSVVLEEIDGPIFLKALKAAERAVMSAVNVSETRMVLHWRKGRSSVLKLDEILEDMSAEIVPFDVRAVEHAFYAYRLYGKGTGHPARLNMGDCAAYGLARSTGLPLLFKGEDFEKTDVTSALPLLLAEAEAGA